MKRLLLTGLMCAVAAASSPNCCRARTLFVDGSELPEQGNGSQERPFGTIQQALDAAQPGDAVVIAGGLYRERLRLSSGEPGRPVTVRAADGQRVIVSGCRTVSSWRSAGNGLSVAELPSRPARVLLDGRRMIAARMPEQGWWRAEKAGDDQLIDASRLKGWEGPAGGEAYVWLQRGNIFKAFGVERIDPSRGALWLNRQPNDPVLSDGDKYWLQHRHEWIRGTGQYAVERAGDRYVLYVRVPTQDDLEHLAVPLETGSVISGRKVAHVHIEGLEIRGGARDGIELTDVSDVIIRRCNAYENGRNGISLRGARDCRVEGCVVWRNRSGLSVSYSENTLLEHNDVAFNDVDGILVTWQSRNITVRANCSHHHLLWGHPDNVQTYRDVENVRFENNLLLAGGQSVMMEQTRPIQFVGNMMVGCDANMLIFGHSNAGHALIRNNTLALSGYSCMSLTWEDYRVEENVFMTGHGGVVYGVRGIPGYQADRNLFWGSVRAEEPRIMATDAGWLGDFDTVRRSTGQDAHSRYADPRFRCGPDAFGVLDHRRLHDCSRDRLFLRGGTKLFKRGDHVELDFDGSIRTVSETDGQSITITPPLDRLPVKSQLVVNWGQRRAPQLDLRLAADSPGADLSAAGGPVGSKIDIQAYLKGDFTGDGRIDRAAVAPALQP